LDGPAHPLNTFTASPLSLAVLLVLLLSRYFSCIASASLSARVDFYWRKFNCRRLLVYRYSNDE